MDCEDTLNSSGVIPEVDVDDMCEYKFDYSFDVQLDTQGELQIHDIYDLLNQVEYEHFVFPIDSMHESIYGYDY